MNGVLAPPSGKRGWEGRILSLRAGMRIPAQWLDSQWRPSRGHVGPSLSSLITSRLVSIPNRLASGQSHVPQSIRGNTASRAAAPQSSALRPVRYCLSGQRTGPRLAPVRESLAQKQQHLPPVVLGSTLFATVVDHTTVWQRTDRHVGRRWPGQCPTSADKNLLRPLTLECCSSWPERESLPTNDLAVVVEYARRSGRAAEGAGFENRCTGDRTGGSNPSSSVFPSPERTAHTTATVQQIMGRGNRRTAL
jgi:hypothetical protein